VSIVIKMTPKTRNCKMCYGRGYLKNGKGGIANCVCRDPKDLNIVKDLVRIEGSKYRSERLKG